MYYLIFRHRVVRTAPTPVDLVGRVDDRGLEVTSVLTVHFVTGVTILDFCLE